MAERNSGHGHVYPRPDGVRMRCGGPALCPDCARDLAQKEAAEAPAPLTYEIADDLIQALDGLADQIAMPMVMFAAKVGAQRDEARAELAEARALNNRLIRGMQSMLDAWPETSWGSSEEARDTARVLLNEIAEQGATMGSPEQPPTAGDPSAQ